jgi:hypothetical protein
LMSGAELPPFAHDLAGRRQQAVFGPAGRRGDPEDPVAPRSFLGND